MANTIETQTIVDGDRNLVVHVHIDGDGTGEETNTVLIDASTYTPAFTDVKLMSISSNLIGFSAELIWDATVNVHGWVMPDYEQDKDFSKIGGLVNRAGAGKTGDMLLTTVGLGAGDTGHAILTFKKKNNVQ